MKKIIALFLVMCSLIIATYGISANTPKTMRPTPHLKPEAVQKEVEMVVYYDDSGWYAHAGHHNPALLNYLAGRWCNLVCSDGATTFRNFFVFDLATVPGPILNGSLTVENPIDGYDSQDPSETWTIYEVSTPVDTLVISTESVPIYNDLGSGTTYGSAVVTASSRMVEISLNNDAVNALNSSIGNKFAIGGALTSLAGGETPENIFGNTNDPAFVRKLTLTVVFEATDFIYMPTIVKD